MLKAYMVREKLGSSKLDGHMEIYQDAVAWSGTDDHCIKSVIFKIIKIRIYRDYGAHIQQRKPSTKLNPPSAWS